MGGENKLVMQNFTLKNIPNLDICVLGALELFMDERLPKIKIMYKHPLIVGSGNAEATGKIMFGEKDAIFSSESNFEEKLKKIKTIDGVVLISASGAKHSPMICRVSKKYKRRVTLITNTKDSLAEKELDLKEDKIFIFPKQREPYTYNTSTYMGMILEKTKESPKKIYDYIKNKISKLELPDFRKYDKYYLIVPKEFSEIIRMLEFKFIELFGRKVARDIETIEEVKHATTLVPSNELFISFGVKNKNYGKNKLYIPLPKNADYGTMMAISYFMIGRIQAEKEPYFKKNISRYVKEASKIFKQKINPIVE